MADKTVAVRLIANYKQYLQESGQATNATIKLAAAGNALGDEVKRAGGGIGRTMAGIRRDVAKASDESLRTIGHASLLAGGAVAVGMGLAVHAAMGFEQQMSDLQAVSGETADSMGRLRDQAIEAGAATVFSASEAAQAQVELAKAGIATDDILSGGLRGALDLASAGNLELGRAAEIAANGMTTFKLKGSDVPRIADSLAAGANKSAGSVEGMAQSLSQSGLVAAQLGLSLEETVGILAMFAQAGLKGSDAGTSLKTALMRLTPGSKEAAGMMNNLGLSFYNAEGNFIGITAAAQALQEKLAPLSQEQRQVALQTIFGQDAIRSATILYEAGGKGVSDWTAAVSESGYAAELARVKTDNLAGDLEALKGSFETVLIQGGSAAAGALRGVAQGLTTVVNGAAEMPAPLQIAGVGLVGITTAGLGVVGMVGTFLPKIREVKDALMGMGDVGQLVGRNLGTLGLIAGGATIAFAGVAFIFGKIAEANAEAARKAEEYTNILLKQGGEMETLQRTAENLANSMISEQLRATNADWQVFGEGVRNSREELRRWEAASREFNGMDRMDESIRAAAASGNALASELVRLMDTQGVSQRITKDVVETLLGEADALHAGSEQAATKQKVLDGLNTTMGATKPGVDELSGSFDGQAESVTNSKTALEEYSDALKALVDPLFGAVSAVHGNAEAQRDEKTAAEDLAKARREHGVGSREAADAEARLAEAQMGTAKSALEVELAMAKLVDMVRQNPAALEASKAKLAEWVAQGWISQETATITAGKFTEVTAAANEIPALKQTTVKADASQAIQEFTDLATAMGSLPSVAIGAPVTIAGETYTAYGPGYAVTPRAAGGPLRARSIYEVDDTTVPEVATLGNRTLLFTGGQSGHMTPMPSYPMAPQQSQGAQQVVVTVQPQDIYIDGEKVARALPARVVNESIDRFHRANS